MTNKERELLLALANVAMVWDEPQLDILKLAKDAVILEAEALDKQIDTEIAATTVGIQLVKIDDLFKAFQTFQSEMQQAATNHSKIFAARAKFREFCERHRLPIDWNDHSGK